MNIIVTSVLHPCPMSLSYSKTRNPFSQAERFKQTIDALKTLDKNLWQNIIVAEGSSINKHEKDEMLKYCDKVLELRDVMNIRRFIDSPYKGVGEAALLQQAINDLRLDETFFKLSARYSLTNKFDVNKFINVDNCFRKFGDTFCTIFYKITQNSVPDFVRALKYYEQDCNMKDPMGIEYELCKRFIYNIREIDVLGVSGIQSCDNANYIEV